MQKQIERLIDKVIANAPYHDIIAMQGGVKQIDDILASIEGSIEAYDCGDITRDVAVAEVCGLADQLCGRAAISTKEND